VNGVADRVRGEFLRRIALGDLLKARAVNQRDWNSSGRKLYDDNDRSGTDSDAGAILRLHPAIHRRNRGVKADRRATATVAIRLTARC